MKTFRFVFLLIFITTTLTGQYKARIVFYNVENLFDTDDDSLTNDEEFLPEGSKKWTNYRFYNKLNKIYKVMAAIGEDEPPEIIALAEIENGFVLHQLINKTPLSKYPYRMIHSDSPDKRGIDVAIIYRSDRVTLRNREFIPVRFGNSQKTTRDILMAEFMVNGEEDLHLFVNHWPSRYGGQQKSKPYRMQAAQNLKSKTDSIFQNSISANIIICGDFNDDPDDVSLTEGLEALILSREISETELYNLSYTTRENCSCGTLKYRSEWNFFDQFIVSGSMLNEKGIRTNNSFQVFRPEFLLENDAKYGGYKPFRTYQGPLYKNGFSDHLPVYLDIF